MIGARRTRTFFIAFFDLIAFFDFGAFFTFAVSELFGRVDASAEVVASAAFAVLLAISFETATPAAVPAATAALGALGALALCECVAFDVFTSFATVTGSAVLSVAPASAGESVPTVATPSFD